MPGRIYFFKAMVQKNDGDYDGALKSLGTCVEKYPRDRVVLNQIGRILFLQRRYKEAVDAFQRVLGVDPEDLQAHYNLMLCYRGLGEPQKAEREEKLFRADQLEHVYTLRRGLGQMPPQSGMEWLIKRIANTTSNDALLTGL